MATMSKFDCVLGLIAILLLTLFWSGAMSVDGTLWNYGYIQLLLGSLGAALFGAFVDRFIHS